MSDLDFRSRFPDELEMLWHAARLLSGIEASQFSVVGRALAREWTKLLAGQEKSGGVGSKANTDTYPTVWVAASFKDMGSSSQIKATEARAQLPRYGAADQGVVLNDDPDLFLHG